MPLILDGDERGSDFWVFRVLCLPVKESMKAFIKTKMVNVIK